MRRIGIGFALGVATCLIVLCGFSVYKQLSTAVTSYQNSYAQKYVEFQAVP